MRIGVASPISSKLLKRWLDEPFKKVAEKLSDHDGPAVTNLVDEWCRMGHDVVVFTRDPYAMNSYKLMGKHLTIYVVPLRYEGWKRIFNRLHISAILRPYLKMREVKEKVDIMSVHWTREYAIAARYYFGKCPVTCTVRDIQPELERLSGGKRNQEMYWRNKVTMECSKYHFISNSEYTAAMVKKYWGWETPVIYNSISPDFLNEDISVESYDKYTFVSIATVIDERKNHLTMLKAFRLLHREYPDTQLLLIGDCFKDGNGVVEQWKNDSLLDGVVLMGKKNHTEIKRILLQSHCLVHPALEETFGNILIEAMACRCLCIGGKDSGAVPYVLRHGKQGLICDVTSHVDIYSTMKMALAGNHTEKVSRAYQSILDEFSSVNVAKQYVKLFEGLLK